MEVKSGMALLLLMLTLRGGISLWAEEVDRVLAVAGRRAITWSAALREANSEAFQLGRPPLRLRLTDPGALDQVQAAVERLADQAVIEKARQGSAFALNGETELRSRVDVLWAAVLEMYPTAEQLQALLPRYGLEEQELRERLLRQQFLLAFMDYSLRPQVRLDADQIAAYYRDEFLPQYQEQQPSAAPPALDEVRSRIEEILFQREMSRLMEPWLAGLRIEHGYLLMGSLGYPE